MLPYSALCGVGSGKRATVVAAEAGTLYNIGWIQVDVLLRFSSIEHETVCTVSVQLIGGSWLITSTATLK